MCLPGRNFRDALTHQIVLLLWACSLQFTSGVPIMWPNLATPNPGGAVNSELLHRSAASSGISEK